MAARNPPPGFPVRTYPAPKVTDQVLIEWVSVEDASYAAIAPGTAHPNQREFAGFVLGIQRQNPADHNFIQRVWVTDETSPDAYNYALKFAGEDDSFPAFIRTYRERKDTYTPREKGQILGALYKTILTNNGSGYSNGANPSVHFDDPAVAPISVAIAHAVVNPDGSITECVLDDCGEGYQQDVEFHVEPPINGTPAEGIAYVQPTTCVLTREEAALYPSDSEFYAQYFQVTRVYETLPGPTFNTTKIGDDGTVTNVATTRGLCSDIVSGELVDSGIWIRTTKEQTDIDVICNQVQETNSVPGNEIDTITYPYGPNGRRVTESRIVERATYTRTANGTANDNFASALLVDEKLEPVQGSLVVARKIGTYDEIPVAANQQGLGYFVEYPYDGDPNFPRLTWRFQILRSAATTAAALSTCPISGFTSLELVDQKTEEADELIEVKVVRTYEILPGKDLVKTTIDDDGDKVTETRTKVEASTITTSITTAGGVYTKTFEEPIGGEVAWKVVQVKATQNTLPSYEVEIPDLIPSIFTGLLPITTTESVVIGTASQPTLATGDLMRRQAQINYNTYRLTIRGRAGLSLPQSIVVSREVSEEYGGEQLKTTGYLNSSEPAVETGLGIVSSIVKNLGNGTFFRQTEKWDTATFWPILTEYDQDPETQSLITTTYQVVDATMVVAPSIVVGTITRYKKIDQWRSIEIIEVYSVPADYEEQRFMAHQFPSLWDYTTYNYSTACGPTGPIREGFSTFVQARLAISFTTTKQTITGLTLIPNTIRLVHDIINQVLNDAGTITYSGTCSGPITFPASDPTFTDYVSGIPIQGTEQLISGESVLWRAGLYKNSSLYVSML